MRIYIAYKLSGSDITALRSRLEEVSNIIAKLGHQTFVFVRDMQQWQPGGMTPEEIMKKATEEMRKCDAIVSIIETQEKSEGLLIESGFMKGLGKRVIVAAGPEGRGFFLKAIADDLIEFKDMADFEKKIQKILKK